MSARWFHDVRMCTNCSYRRRVKVLAYTKPGETKETESWNRLCTICKLVERAEIHQRAANRFLKRATELRMRRHAHEASKRSKREQRVATQRTKEGYTR